VWARLTVYALANAMVALLVRERVGAKANVKASATENQKENARVIEKASVMGFVRETSRGV
jgi:hypothetical protein